MSHTHFPHISEFDPFFTLTGAAAIGLCLTNQQTCVFYCIPFALWALWLERSALMQPTPLIRLCVCGLFGLTPYLLLSFLSGPKAAWGSWGEQRSVLGLVRHMLRSEYGTFRLANIAEVTTDEFWLRAQCYTDSLPKQLPPYGMPLAAIGICVSLLERRKRPLGCALLFAFLFYVLPFNHLSNLPASSPFYLQVQQRFWPQANLIISIWYAVGLELLSSGLVPDSPALKGGVMSALTLASVTIHARRGWEESDCSGNTLFEQFGRSVLEAIPNKDKVILLTTGDEVINAVRYVHRNLGERPRLVVIDNNYAQFGWWVHRARQQSYYENVSFPGGAYGSAEGSYLMHDFLDANYPTHSIYICGGFIKADTSWEANYELWPMGLVSQIIRRGATVDVHKWSARATKRYPALEWHRPPIEGSWEEIVARNHYRAAYLGVPFHALQHAYKQPGAADERERFYLAARLYEGLEAVVLNGSTAWPDFAYRNLGVAYSQLLRLESSLEGQAAAKQRATQAFIRYLRFETLSEEDRRTVEEGVMSLVAPPPQGVPKQQQPPPQQQPLPPQQQHAQRGAHAPTEEGLRRKQEQQVRGEQPPSRAARGDSLPRKQRGKKKGGGKKRPARVEP